MLFQAFSEVSPGEKLLLSESDFLYDVKNR